jgi:WXG100 family type VII secretion target
MSRQMKMRFGDMEQLLLSLAQANASIEATLEQLDERVATLRSQWSGEASDAYDHAQRQSRNQLREMNGILSRSHTAADQIVTRHRAAAAEVAKLWK